MAGIAIQLFLTTVAGSRSAASAATDGDGAFAFSGLDTDVSLQYNLSVSFANVAYASMPITFTGGPEQVTDVTVFGTTPNAEAISVDRLSMVVAGVDNRQGVVTIVESYRVTNSGLLTYVGQADQSQKKTLEFPLFQGARRLTPFGGFTAGDAITTAAGFALSTPVLPGNSAISFTYAVGYRSDQVALARPLSYPTALVEVILPGGIEISSPELPTRNTVQLNGRSFATIQGNDLRQGTELHLFLSGLPAIRRGSTLLDSRTSQTLLLLGATGTAIAVLSGARALSRPAAQRGPHRRRDRLIRGVARLDNQAEQGRIDAQEYMARRAQAILDLEELTLRIRREEHKM